MSRLVAVAQQRGSTATTPAGARRYLRRCWLRQVRPLPLPPQPRSRMTTRASRREWDRARDERRAERICAALGLPVRPDPAERADLLAQLAPAQLGAACHKAIGLQLGPYAITAEEAVAEILRRIGPAGEQARADEARYLESYDVQQYESRKHAGRDWRAVSLAAVRSDSAAAIIAYAEVGSYLHRGSFEPGAGGLHHLRIHAYLVVRDATTGERHILRIPPRFGRYRSATWRRHVRVYPDRVGIDADALIHAAVAWTFGLAPGEYHPEVAA